MTGVQAGLVGQARALLGSDGGAGFRAPAPPAGIAAPARAVCLLGVGPTALAVAPGLLAGDVAAATGAHFGPVALQRVIGAAAAVALVVWLRRRGRDRWAVATATSVGSALILLACGLAATPPPVVPVLGGLAFTLAFATLGALVADAAAVERRATSAAWFAAGVLVGVAVVPATVVVVGGLGGTVRTTFLALGVLAVGASMAATTPRGDRPALDDAAVRAVVRRTLGHAEDSPVEAFPGERGELRRVLETDSLRAAAPTAIAIGVVLGPLPRAVDLLLRDRWLIVEDSRRFGLAVLVALGLAVQPLVAKRVAVAWRIGPARLGHLAAWMAVAVGLALAITGSTPSVLLASAALAAGTGLSFALIGCCVVLATGAVDAHLRTHATAVLAAVVLAGAVVGDVVATSFGSRFGVGWSAVALGSVFVLGGARLARSLPDLEADAAAVATRIVEGEELLVHRSAGRRLPLLSCQRVDFSYGQVQVLFDVSCSIDEGEMVALLGTNGAGKSTLLRVISGLGIPSRGSVHYDGRDITFAPTDARVAMGISQIPGGKAVFGPLTVVENLRAFAYSCGRQRATVERAIDETFAAFPRLSERRNQLAATLSGGEQQMLALGKALILKPRLLLIDELSLGLAPIVVGELLAMVQRINSAGTAIVLVEQSVNVALSLVDRAYFMEKGQVRFDGTAVDLVQRPDLLRTVFLAGAEQGLATQTLSGSSA